MKTNEMDTDKSINTTEKLIIGKWIYNDIGISYEFMPIELFPNSDGGKIKIRDKTNGKIFFWSYYIYKDSKNYFLNIDAVVSGDLLFEIKYISDSLMILRNEKNNEEIFKRNLQQS
jgi:hypothetical protein